MFVMTGKFYTELYYILTSASKAKQIILCLLSETEIQA